MRRLRLPVTMLTMLFLVATTAQAAVQRLERVSVSSDGEQANGPSSGPAISADGRYVAFVSAATNLVPGDTNGKSDIFVRDRVAGTIQRVSLSSSGEQANDHCAAPDVSADGHMVCFSSAASNLVSGDTNGKEDVFLHDRTTGATERVSVSSSGAEGSGISHLPALSADGRIVAFLSEAVNLVPSDTNTVEDVFLRDRAVGKTERVSVSSSGAQANDRSWHRPALSADGRVVAFASFASNLVADDTNRVSDAFVRDRATSTTEGVSLLPEGDRPNYLGSEYVAISADGQRVAFGYLSYRPGSTTILLRDRGTGTVTPTRDLFAPNTGVVALSPDGSALAVFDRRTDTASRSGPQSVYVYDVVTASGEFVDLPPFETTAQQSLTFSLADGGRFVAFASGIESLVGDDTNGTQDVFVAQRGLAVTAQQITVFRPGTREWFLRGADPAPAVVSFGGPNDLPVPANYLGRGAAQVAVFRPFTQEWFIRAEDGTTSRIQYGGLDDVPIPGDYRGKGSVQIAVFRRRTGGWFIRGDEELGRAPIQFGQTGDQPVPADYLGTGKTQLTVFRPSTREWFIRRDDGSGVHQVPFGGPNDLPVPGDYLGLRRAQIAVFRPPTGEWFIRRDDGTALRIEFGAPGDVPVPGDYVGSGKSQMAVYRPATGEWYLREETGAATRIAFGGPGDQPVPAAFAPRFGQ